MDASQQLLFPDDSFSCGWLIDVKSSGRAAAAAEAVGDSQRSHDGAGSFIEIEPDYFFSIRWSTNEFDFGLPSPECSAQVHADQIFSDGHLLPLRHDGPPSGPSAADAPSGPRLAKSQSANSNRLDSPPQKTLCPATKSSSSSSSSLLRSKSQKKNTCKYFCFLMPLYKTVKDLRLLSSSSPSLSSSSSSSSSFKSANTGKDSTRSSPRTSDAMSSVDLWRGINADISIDDAILHCKKSIGRGN